MRHTTKLTEGPILNSLFLFALPMMAGNLLQQVYNIADSMIVGKYVSANALAAVGSAYSLMTFLTSLIIGLCMGSGALFSASFGAGRTEHLKKDIWLSFCFVGSVTALILLLVFPGTDLILRLLQVPAEVYGLLRLYVRIVFCGIPFVALYNFCAYLLRALGNSAGPLYFLAASSILNVLLDLLAVIFLGKGVGGAAAATLLAQCLSGGGLLIYTLWLYPELRLSYTDLLWDRQRFGHILTNDLACALQQSVMNFGILMIQGLVNSFGAVVMAAFAAAVKIDTFAYMPAQEFGNAYSIFISQNFGGGQKTRIRKGTRLAFLASASFCLLVSVAIYLTAGDLMGLFVQKSETAIIAEGIRYLRIEGACYIGIGCLFLWYAYFRGIQKPGISLVLTIVSLGSRVLISYSLAPRCFLGVVVIWAAIPIGWGLADLAGLFFYRKNQI